MSSPERLRGAAHQLRQQAARLPRVLDRPASLSGTAPLLGPAADRLTTELFLQRQGMRDVAGGLARLAAQLEDRAAAMEAAREAAR